MFRRVGWALALAAAAVVFFACARTRTPQKAAPPLDLEAALGGGLVEAGSSQALVARVAIASRARTSAARPPVNLALLVDTSGSMEGRAIEDARKAALALLGALRKEDRVAVVAFHSAAEVVLPSTRLADLDEPELRAKIAAMKAQGTTDMASGLRLAVAEVTAHLEPEGVNRIVLLGDGVPNDDRQILPIVQGAAARGVSVTALGLGDDYDETLMGRVARQSGGRFFYVEDSAKVASFFAEEVVRLERVVAKNAVLELRPGPGVTVTRVIGRESQTLERGVSVPLGDVSLGEEQEVVLELASAPARSGASVEVLDAVLRYQDGLGGVTREERVFVGARASADLAAVEASRQQAVHDAAARARDAAATLERIEQERGQDRAKTAPAAPSPSPEATDENAALRPPASASEIRRLHGEAMRRFQAH